MFPSSLSPVLLISALFILPSLCAVLPLDSSTPNGLAARSADATVAKRFRPRPVSSQIRDDGKDGSSDYQGPSDTRGGNEAFLARVPPIKRSNDLLVLVDVTPKTLDAVLSDHLDDNGPIEHLLNPRRISGMKKRSQGRRTLEVVGASPLANVALGRIIDLGGVLAVDIDGHYV